MFGRKKRQKDPLKKGCWSRWGSTFIAVIIMLVIGAIISINGIITGTQNLQKYITLTNELQNPVDESVVAPNKITAEDKQNFQYLFNESVHNLDGRDLFDGDGYFIAENLSDPTQLEFLQDLTLSGADLACFLNALLSAEWMPELYKNGKSLVDVLQTSLSTEDGRTTFAAVAKINIPELLADTTSDISEIKELLDGLPKYIYLSLESSFNFEEESTNPASTLQINQLSAESNSLLLDFLFSELGENPDTAAENLNEIINFLLEQLELLSTTFGCTATFADGNLILRAAD